jgi:hypothetical protein
MQLVMELVGRPNGDTALRNINFMEPVYRYMWTDDERNPNKAFSFG